MSDICIQEKKKSLKQVKNKGAQFIFYFKLHLIGNKKDPENNKMKTLLFSYISIK